jgi:hypothetical protein
MGEKDTATGAELLGADRGAGAGARESSTPSVSEVAPATGNAGAERSAGAPLKGVDVKLG